MIFVYKSIHDIFTVSFITYVIYLGLELAFEGLISNYFDLNILLIVVMCSGLLSLFWRARQNLV